MSKWISLLDAAIARALVVFERVWPLIKGAPHNRLAWLVVSAGVLVIAGPVWEPYVRALLSKYLELQIGPPTHPAWGGVLICVGLGYHLLAYRADGLRKELAEARVRDHDGPIVRSFQADFPEQKLRYILELLANDHSIFSHDQMFLDDLMRRLLSSDFHLLDTKLSDQANEFKKGISALCRFLGREFFVPVAATTANRVCLRPDWNSSRSGMSMPTSAEEAMYSEKSDELVVKIRSTTEQYLRMIRLAHERVL